MCSVGIMPIGFGGWWQDYHECYAMLCYAMLCYAMLCYAILRYCYAMLYYGTPYDSRINMYVLL